MFDSESRGIEHAMKFYAEHGNVSRQEILDLAEAAEDGDNEAHEQLRNYAEQYDVEWAEGDFSKMGGLIAEAIENSTQDDSLGSEFE